jgi:hypothetical protein
MRGNPTKKKRETRATITTFVTIGFHATASL